MAILFHSRYGIVYENLYLVDQRIAKIEKFKTLIHEGPFDRIEGFCVIDHHQ